MALRHTGRAAGSASALASYGTYGIHAQRADSQRGQSHRTCGSVSGAPRHKGHMSDRKMACPAALPAVHVVPASSPRRMLRSPSVEATCRPSQHAYRCTAPPSPPKPPGRRRSSSRNAR